MSEEGGVDLVNWVIGVLLLAILGINVAIPVVVDSVNAILPNVTGVNATLLQIIPTFVIIVVILMLLGRR